MPLFTLPGFLTARLPALGRLALAGGGLALATLLPGAAQAQAPTWQDAFSSNPNQPTGGMSEGNATAVDAAGNVYVTGTFLGQITFGNFRLTSAGSYDVFVAKWDAASKTWTSAVRGGGTGNDQSRGIAVASAGGTTSVYATGFFASGTGASMAGTALPGAGGTDI